MNYYSPRELQDAEGNNTGKWHYTCLNKRTGTYPVGYCADDCPGHDTPEGAREHMTAYCLDNHIRLDGECSGAKYQCEIEGCDEWTQYFASVGGVGCIPSSYNLCDEHRTEETVRELFGSVGDVTSS